MKKKCVVLLMILLMVFASSASALASPQKGKSNKNYQWDQNQKDQNEDMLQLFTDMPQNHWAYKTIQKMKKLGIINGNPDGNFYPESSVTRAEFATMLVKTLNLPINQGTTQTFIDIPTNFWGFNYIEASKNYLTGYQNPSGTLYFNPQGPAVREDIIVAMVKAQGLENEQPDLSVLSKFADANKISINLKAYVAIAVKNGLVGGSTNQTGMYYLKPQDKLTRAEAATFLSRIPQDNKVIVGQQSGNNNSTHQGPILSTATVSGATLTLTYNESLDTSSVPTYGDFTLSVNGIVQVAPTSITISGSTITITLYQAIPTGSAVTISYTPGTHPIRDLTGYITSALVNYQVNSGNWDINSPLWPQGSALGITNISTTSLTLNWPQATDNVSVTGYRIFQDGNLLTTVGGSVYSYNVVGLLSNTNHTFRVDAGDAAGNWTTGPSVSITTS